MNELDEHETTDRQKVSELSILLGLVKIVHHPPLSEPEVICKEDLPKGRVWFTGKSWSFNVCFKRVRLKKAGFKTEEEAEAAKVAYLQRRLKQLQNSGQ